MTSRAHRGSLVAALLLGWVAAPGCGSSSPSGGGDGAAAFAGAWTFDSGSIVPMCSMTIANVDLTGIGVVFTKTDPTHINLVTTSGITCDLSFTVSGSTATATSGQTCSLATGTVLGTVAVGITSWTLTLSGNAIASTMHGTASALIVTCTPSSTGTLSRQGGGDAGAG